MKGFPETELVYDRAEKAVYEYAVVNGDYATKKEKINPKKSCISKILRNLRL